MIPRGTNSRMHLTSPTSFADFQVIERESTKS
jgi:hypothetical protein